MSCSGQHFSVHSPDCKAHLNIQSNRMLQVDPIASSSSVTQLDGPHASSQPNSQNNQLEPRAWSSASMDTRQTSLTPRSPVQMLQLQAYEDATIRCPSGELVRGQHAHGQDENNYTLVILDCSPHPTSESGGLNDQRRQMSGQATRCESTSCDDCKNRCHCQTELIVRQQIEHDHTCQHHRQHFNQSQQQQQQQNQFYGSGSLADRSASQTTTRSQETVTSQQPPLITLQESPVPQTKRSPLQQIQQSSSSTNYTTTTTMTQQQQQQQREREQQERQRQYRMLEDENWAYLNQQQTQRPQPSAPSWQQVERQQTTTTTTTSIDRGAQRTQPQHKQAQDANPFGQQSRLSPRSGMKIIRRWNFNQAQFEEIEVPDRPQAKPAPQDEVFAKSPSSLKPASDAWNQEIYALSSELSPVPPVQYEPSWLAYRKPDEESVQADPLYQDLMMELRRLEEGVDLEQGERSRNQQQVDPIVTPDCQQKPTFGQALLPESVELNEYENVEFIGRLIPNSDPTMKVEWTKNGQALLESSRLTSEYEFGVVRLVIRRCEAEDSGIYQCKATNQLGESVSRAKLLVHAKGNVQYETLHPAGMEKIRQLENPPQVHQIEETPVQQAPKFLTHITDYVEKDEGESVHFECCLGPVDDPDMKTEWFFNGRPLVTGSRFHTIDDFGFIVLDIDWLFPRDTGEYICRATNKWGTDFTRTVLRVRPAKNIILDSQLADNADATIDKLRQLEFPDVPGEVFVEEPKRPAHFVEPLRAAQDKRQYVEGENVHFEARAGPASDGQLTVEWFHNGRPLISGHRFKPTFDFGHILLDILYVYPEDSGVYRCVARNGQGETASEFEIQVAGKQSIVYQSQLPKEMEGGVQKITEMEAMWNRAPDPEEEEAPAERRAPELVLHLKPCVAFEGSCARFCCRIVAHPRPRVAWFINGQLVVSGLRYKLTHDGMYHLIIPKCQLSDAGRVRVVAKNLLGECSSETELQVRRKVDDYRGVLKNSPNPWYDEATLKMYRRQRNQADDNDDADSEDFDEFLANFQKQRALQAQQELEQRRELQQNFPRIAVEHQTTSPIANQVIGYMEPDTPDVNLLASGSSKSPLVEPGDLHPVVIEQQAIMAPAPSTIGRALSSKDQVQSTAAAAAATPTAVPDVRKTFASAALANQKQQDEGEIRSLDSNLTQEQQQQHQQRVFGLVSRRNQAQSRFDSSQKQMGDGYQAQQQAHTSMQHGQQQSQQQQQQRVFGPPPASPENVEHGKEIHSHFHKQLQVERRPNKEIMREIIEKETFEQEHHGFSKENLIRDESQERAIARQQSATPTPADSNQHQIIIEKMTRVDPQLQNQQHGRQLAESQQQKQVIIIQTSSGQQQQQQHGGQQTSEQLALIEEHMIPPEFVQKIQPCQAIDGDQARFECVFRGEPKPNISWYRENKLIKPSNLYTIETDLQANKSTLIIKRVTLNGDAVYTVKAENAAGSAKSSANLVVEAHPLPSAARGGQARQFDALDHLSREQYAHSDVRGFSPADSSSEYSLLIDDSLSSQQTQQSGGQQAHKIKSVRTRRLSPDEMGSLIRASPENIVAPTFLHTLNEVHAKPGELARLDARLIGSQPMEVRWLKDSQRVRADKQHKLLLEGDLYTLLILESSPQDEGFYECIAANRVGEARCGATLRVSADGRLSSSSMGSQSMFSTSSMQQFGGQQQQMQTSSSTTTQTTTTATTTSSSSQQHLGAGFGLESGIQGSGQRQHFGLTKKPHHQLMSEYTSAQQAQQQVDQQGRLAALIPKLIKGLDSQQVREGKSVTLRCQISAHPKAEIFWYKEGDKLIKPSKYFRIFKDNDETHCLKILETFPEDQGEYKCVARAQHGQLETSATIEVIPNSPR